MQRWCGICLFASLTLMAPATASAQDVNAGSIAGIVRDASGAVLPGTTVEAASPALIEKVRTAITDGEGRYLITALRPGTYSVTFTLSGFSTVRREGLELTTGFVATVDAELTVGALEETVTVSGAAPIVDVRSSSQQMVLSSQQRAELPIGKNMAVYASLLPGARQNNLANLDVGGQQGERANQIAIHGGKPNDGLTLREGLVDSHLFGPYGANSWSSINPWAIKEVNLQLTGGLTAEALTGGVQTNVIFRDGGNAFSGGFSQDYTSAGLQSTNLDAALMSQGVLTQPKLREDHDTAWGFGGPIKHDTLWFFTDGRYWKSATNYPGNYFNKVPGTLFYDPDFSQPFWSGNVDKNIGVRFTWQASPRNKVSLRAHYEESLELYGGVANSGTTSPEATANFFNRPYKQLQMNWTAPVNSRLLLEAGLYGHRGHMQITQVDQPISIQVIDVSRNYTYGSVAPADWKFGHVNGMAAVSYITGSHAFKVGYNVIYGGADSLTLSPGGLEHDLSYQFNGRTPLAVTYYARPVLAKGRLTWSGLYAQDQWSVRDLTLSLGLRLDTYYGTAPAVDQPGGRFIGPRSFPEVAGRPDWKDTNPRFGIAYNLFGSNTSVIKASLGRFIPFEGLSQTILSAAPANRQVITATRTWRDTNGDYIPQESELGPLSNANFGKPSVAAQYADDVLSGWNTRFNNWQASVSVQHELWPGLAVNGGYYRTWYGNFIVTDNLLDSVSDYSSYCINLPNDPRLPNAGQQVCGLMDLNPAKFGQVSNLVAKADDYGEVSEVYQGIDLTINSRFGNRGLLSGGFSTSQTVSDTCEIMAKLPEMGLIPLDHYVRLPASGAAATRFCRNAPSWWAETQFKLFGAYTLPGDFRVSAVYQNIAGPPTTATYVGNAATNPELVSQLGRGLAGGPNATFRLELIDPYTDYRNGRVSTLGLSVNRVIRVGRLRMTPRLDFHNLLNSNTPLTINLRYGPSWGNVVNFTPPRVAKLGISVEF